MVRIPDSYEISRQRFRDRLVTIQKKWPAAKSFSQSLPYQQDLTIDWIYADSTAPSGKLLVITTGEHGIEGYVGSALLELFFDEFLGSIDSTHTGILFIHAINPWGMKHWKRGNSQNVDLNRNFISSPFSSLLKTNPDYPLLSTYFNPKKKLEHISWEKISFIKGTLQALVRFGVKRTREAALMGQYILPQGVYFGGVELQPETRVLMDLYRAAFAKYPQIIHLDLHTGYGPRYQMTLVNSPLETMSAAETMSKYNLPLVAAANPDDFYTMNGDMLDWEYELIKTEFPAGHIFAATCEFGTFGESLLAGIRSLQITIFKNQVNQYGASTLANKWVEKEYRELYLPSESAWFEKAQSNFRSTINGVLKAEGYL